MKIKLLQNEIEITTGDGISLPGLGLTKLWLKNYELSCRYT